MLEQSIDHERVRPDLLSFLPEEYCRLTAEEQRVSLALYRLLAGADPVGLEPLARAAQLSEQEVRGMLGRWAGVYYDDDGRVIAYWGLALPRMAHRFEVAGRTLYTWCVWDSLFLPELLNATAHVQATCPTTGAVITLTVSPHAIEWVNPPRVVMSFREPDPSQVRRDVITTFCHYVHFFSSADAGRHWVTEHPGTFLLSLGEGLDLARRKNAMQYPDALRGRVVG